MQEDKKRNGTIDCMKFIFAIVVVIYHGSHFLGETRMAFHGGFIAVEFFFLVSGYLLTLKASKSGGGGVNYFDANLDMINSKI